MSNRRITLIPLLALALVPAACGSADDEQPAATAAPAAAAAKPATVPDQLVGRWTTRLPKENLPKALPDSQNPFTVTIAKSGGIDNGPSFSLADSQETIEGEVSTPEFSSGTVTLRGEGCLVEGSGYRFYDNVYRYSVAGDTLRFTVVRNQCKDRAAESILTTRAFKRAS